jgi:hypothetical protein
VGSRVGRVKAGDIVRVIKVPSGLPDESRRVWEFCLGKCFPIEEIEGGRVVVLVGRLSNMEDGFHEIFLDTGEFELIENSN